MKMAKLREPTACPKCDGTTILRICRRPLTTHVRGPEADMLDDNVSEATCPYCKSHALVKGSMSFEAGFAPEPPGWWFGISSFRKMKAVACMDCGMVTQFLSRADVEKMRKKYLRKDDTSGQG